jgi:hypothetical protein
MALDIIVALDATVAFNYLGCSTDVIAGDAA